MKNDKLRPIEVFGFGPHDLFLQGFAISGAISMLAGGSILARSYAVAVVAWCFIAALICLTAHIYLTLRKRGFVAPSKEE